MRIEKEKARERMTTGENQYTESPRENFPEGKGTAVDFHRRRKSSA